MIIKLNKVLTENYILGINTLLFMAKEKGIHMNRTKLQKLLYLWYRACLKDEENSFIPLTDEEVNKKNIFRAWHYGPVIPEIMYYYQHNVLKAIPSIKHEEVLSYNLNPKIEKGKIMFKHLEDVLDKYGHRTASYLTDITHEDQSPYAKTIRKPGGYFERIRDDWIKKS